MPRVRVRQGHICRDILFEGAPLLADLLAAHGFVLPKPCGGAGTCGKCTVTIRPGLSPERTTAPPGTHCLACQTRLQDDCAVSLPIAAGGARIQTDGRVVLNTGASKAAPLGEGYCAAIDLGTTTIALKLLDADTGMCIGTAASLNPQGVEAADVMGRIALALRGGGARLRAQAQDAILSLLGTACGQAGIAEDAVRTLVICANTTMLYLLTGRNPKPLATAPFAADTLFGGWTALLGRQAYLPRCMHAFVGADITCAVMACGMCERDETSLLCDIGTNGEIALWHEGTLRVASTAAGPAFEGALISCGTASVRGAIDRVWIDGGQLAAHTIGGAPATGLCGSGLLDAVAALLRLGRIDETGATEEATLPVAQGVALLPRDIRALQLAKAAIAAGIETLLNEAGVDVSRVSRLFLAGGFGSTLSPDSAARIGLIPQALAARTEPLGNAALAGAAALLVNRRLAETTDALARMARYVNLGGNPAFNAAYVEHMMF